MEHAALIPSLFIYALAFAMLLVIVSDMVRYTIPNLLNLGILLLYGVGIFFLPVHPLTDLAAAGIVLLIGLGFFALGLMGGGDVKLLVVLTLWTGWGQPTWTFFMLTALTGGILVLLVLLLRLIVPPILFRMNPTRPIPRLFTRKQPIPYGLAIAPAFLIMLYAGTVPPFSAHKAAVKYDGPVATDGDSPRAQ